MTELNCPINYLHNSFKDTNKGNFNYLIFSPPGTLEDAEGCGILGGEETEEAPRTDEASEATSGQGNVETCLWTCEWKENPYFKYNDLYWTKWQDLDFTLHNTFPIFYTASKIPRDLNCLSGCFEEFNDESKDWYQQIRKNCSANGLDRTVATHFKEAVDYTSSNYSNSELGPPFYPTGSFHPSLDCMLYYFKELRSGSSYLSDHPPTNVLSPVGSSAAGENLCQTQRFPQKSSLRAENLTCEEDLFQFLFRAFDPVTTAIEICAMAKIAAVGIALQEFDFANNTADPKLSIFNGQTCDSFLPDLFSDTPRCSAHCVPDGYTVPVKQGDAPPPNLISYFNSEDPLLDRPGLWGCQKVCYETEGCEWWTLERVDLVDDPLVLVQGPPNVNRCYLWRSCEKWSFPSPGGGYLTTGNTQYVVSAYWSGPKDPSKTDLTGKCPLVTLPGPALFDVTGTQVSAAIPPPPSQENACSSSNSCSPGSR